MFKKGTALYSYEVRHEAGENVAYINYFGAPFIPSLAENPEVMNRVIDLLIASPNVSRVILVQQRNYNYDFNEIKLLAEIAQVYTFLIKQKKILSPEKLSSFPNMVAQRHGFASYFIQLLKRDPIQAYKDVLSEIEKQEAGSQQDTRYLILLKEISQTLEKTELIQKVMDKLDSYSPKTRYLYSELFVEDIIPNFAFARLVSSLPEDARIFDQYEIGEGEDKSTVTILKRPNDLKYFYHLMPPEYFLNEDHQILLNLARNVLIEHQPKAEEFTDPQRTREVFFNVARDLLTELAESKGIGVSYADLNKLSKILVRHTIGFGLLEVLLQDINLQDIALNAPVSLNTIFLRHSKYDECFTNILLSPEDANSWAAKFRMVSGRALNEASPVLDTDLALEDIRARISIVQQPLSPNGLAYAVRRHRTFPWTLPLFIKNKMLNSFSAGLFSFLIDGSRTMLVAGTRSSGKTSFLGSLMLEIKPKYRVIVIEDSVAGDSQIIIKENGKFQKTTIGKLIDERIDKNGFIDADGREKELNSDNLGVFSVNENGKVVLSKPSKFIRHKTDKTIYEVQTTSGRKIKVTEDHSLFCFDEKNILRPVKSKNLKTGSFIAVPFNLPFDNLIEAVNLSNHLHKFDKKIFIAGPSIEKYIIKNRKELFSLGHSLGYHKSTVQNWTKKKILPGKIFVKVRDKMNESELFLRGSRDYGKIPLKFILDNNFLSFIGLWLADGCYGRNSVIVSVQEEENREIVRKIAKRFGCNVKMHGDRFSLMINSVLLKGIMQKVFELNGNSYTKNIPSWAYNLSDKQIGSLLKGFFSGDGCVSDKEIVFSICSKELIQDISTLLLKFNIVLRGSDLIRKDNTMNCRIGDTKMVQKFNENIGFLVNSKQKKLEKLALRISTHDTSDIIPLSFEVKKELSEILGKKFNKNDYIMRQNNVGRKHLANLLELVPPGVINPVEPLKQVVQSDIFWDKVKKITKINGNGYVYDISVPGCENFICENIVAHNTLELPVEYFRKLDYDILSMKVRSSLSETTAEISAEDGIRTSLRLGDSSLIIGEIRSNEAKALYEAMRVGALANVVAGTVHGSSPYSVFDRIVNDLNVPVTSFKATDLIAVANPIKTPDGLHSTRRIVQLSEVRKHWTKDPLLEKGFVDLLNYDVEKDELIASDDLINGNSQVIKDIAASVRGWAGNWDNVYDNILLRGMIKQELVDISDKLKRQGLLEARFAHIANSIFHNVSDEITQEVGIPDSKLVFPEWKKRVDKEVKKFRE